MTMAVRACIGLGGNVGDVAATLQAAFDALDRLPGTRLLARSRLYRTAAWGNEAQPEFLNAAALVETTLAPRAFLDELLAIERAFGRERRERWGPRTLDLDLLLYGDAVVDVPGLHVPHPYLHERAFVLRPLADVAPDALVPGHGTVDALLVGVDASGCLPLDAAS
jgi:2-amino-4-hydroxy-6-hydroxymethyldihydropteridine diphosphokinase